MTAAIGYQVIDSPVNCFLRLLAPLFRSEELMTDVHLTNVAGQVRQ